MYKRVKNFDELTISDDFMFGIIMRDPALCKPFLGISILLLLFLSVDLIRLEKIIICTPLKICVSSFQN